MKYLKSETEEKTYWNTQKGHQHRKMCTYLNIFVCLGYGGRIEYF